MKRRYRVIGERVVHGHAPGEEFEADSDEFYEPALLGVHLEIVVDSPDKRKPSQPESEQ